MRTVGGSGGSEVVHGGRPLWRRSSRSGNENECVEVAVESGRVRARDSKWPAAAVVTFDACVWSEFVDAVRAGELQNP
ncbi:DUF397 domain-containing protein [Streptomyces sp. SID4950]|nr:DUF397 domain-containing protein [Streptomyces sp. SolWspMP-5a-2]MYQ65920.1 DUF397 domain-containing protein [Streptomyces sp. SID4950]